MEEKWLPFPHFDLKNLYKISSIGRVESLNNWKRNGNKMMKPYFNKARGYYYINCQNRNRIYTLSIHRLVAMAFIPNSNPSQYIQVDHIDFDKKNNCVGNLRWCTRSENIKRNFDLGHHKGTRGEESGSSKLTNLDVLNLRKLHLTGKYTHKELAREFNIAECTATLIINRHRWAHI